VSPGFLVYRALTRAAGAVVPRIWRPRAGDAGGVEDPWRGGLRGASEETARAAGSVWVHAASLGEVAAARGWIEALLARGYRPPFLLTTRTRTGLDRARATWGDRVAARIAPHDFPQTVGAVLDDACPWRLDIIETELWPNLIAEARARGVAVVIVGGTVSEGTTARLLRTRVAGVRLFGEGVYALPQSDRHAARFHRLGVPLDRIRVIGDLKASAARPRGAGEPASGSRTPFASRPALVFGSLRPGEERAARLLADVLEAHRVRAGETGAGAGAGGRARGALDGRSRAVLVVAPRHSETEAPVRAALEGAGFKVLVRDERSRGGESIGAWIESVAAHPGRRAALLATRGELPAAYDHAWGALVGGTLAPYGGHNVWEPAARECPVIVGPHHADVDAAVDALRAEGGGIAVADERHLVQAVEGWLRDLDLELRGRSASRAAAVAAGAASRGADALQAWGLTP
jgi:3-deoxy-D-manno-octulosonic-acid transferase